MPGAVFRPLQPPYSKAISIFICELLPWQTIKYTLHVQSTEEKVQDEDDLKSVAPHLQPNL